MPSRPATRGSWPPSSGQAGAPGTAASTTWIASWRSSRRAWACSGRRGTSDPARRAAGVAHDQLAVHHTLGRGEFLAHHDAIQLLHGEHADLVFGNVDGR